MAVEAKDLITYTLKRLSPDHPDRGVLEENLKSLTDHLTESEAYKIRSLYETKAHTPELITEVWQRFWNWRIEKGLAEIKVPPCDRSSEEIKELKEKGRMLVYVPPELSAQEGLEKLDRFFTSYTTDLLKAEDITNKYEQHGWLDVEKSIRAPHLRQGEATITLMKINAGLEVQTLNTYIISSEFRQLVSGHYFDEDTFSRVASECRGENLIVRQQILSTDGSHLLILLEEENNSLVYPPLVGFRFAGKKAS